MGARWEIVWNYGVGRLGCELFHSGCKIGSYDGLVGVLREVSGPVYFGLHPCGRGVH